MWTETQQVSSCWNDSVLSNTRSSNTLVLFLCIYSNALETEHTSDWLPTVLLYITVTFIYKCLKMLWQCLTVKIPDKMKDFSRCFSLTAVQYRVHPSILKTCWIVITKHYSSYSSSPSESLCTKPWIGCLLDIFHNWENLKEGSFLRTALWFLGLDLIIMSTPR